METAYPRLKSTPSLDEWADDTVDEMAERFAHLPCPALEADGTCSIYSHRPITCRTMGIPGESDGIVHGACAVQTAVPIVRLSATLRRDADRLAEHEALSLSILRRPQSSGDDEILLPYGFVPNGDPTP
jgi:Fe-S-cluster containining protein